MCIVYIIFIILLFIIIILFIILCFPFLHFRFQDLVAHIRFDKISQRPKKGEPVTDRLYKIRHVFDNFLRRFKEAYVCGKDVTVDEAMISYRGRCVFVQYAPNKPCKYGIKVSLIIDLVFLL